MPTWGVDTLPTQRVPQKILNKSISLYYIPYTMYRDFLAIKSVTPVKPRRARRPKHEPSLNKTPPLKLSKKCHLCHIDIQGSGVFWRFPLYSHYSRMHFGEELVRDFRTLDRKCAVCGIEEESLGKRLFVVHLGAKHRLVENFMNKRIIMGFESAIDTPADDSALELLQNNNNEMHEEASKPFSGEETQSFEDKMSPPSKDAESLCDTRSSVEEGAIDSD